jgi:biofilm PGA synthesis N-glycosyltransferase PgaC
MIIFIFLFFLLFVVYAALIIYYSMAWNAIPKYEVKQSPPGIPTTKISVIIPARNEENNIMSCVDSLSKQTYPRNMFEVIIVDDHSTDATWNMLTNLTGRDIKIIPIKLSGYTNASSGIKAYKKMAIEKSIEASTGTLVVTTDADCSFQPDWLQTIADFYISTGAKFIAAPVKINATNSLLSIFQTLDFIILQGITGASVFKRVHSMCNGANLAYERKVFYEVDGFRDIDHIPSGDDMLLMYKIFKKYPQQVFFLKDKKAIVSTQPETSWKGFVNQRIRWASKASHYDDKRIFWVLVLVYAVNLLFFGLFIASFWNSIFFLAFLLMLFLKIIVEYPFARSVSTFFNQQKLLAYFPFFQPLHILYTIVIGWLGKFGSYQWKEREIK